MGGKRLRATKETTDYDILDTTTTADVSFVPNGTTGAVNIATNATRSGTITIGNPSSAGWIVIDSGSFPITMGGSMLTIPNICTGEDPTTVATLMTGHTTGDILFAPALTTGNITFVGGTSRSGAFQIGSSAATGPITIDSGSGVTTHKGGTYIVDTGGTGNITLGSNMTSGSCSIAPGAGRTASITIGNSSSTGVVRIETTGNIDVGNSITSGTVRIADTATRTGSIAIGHPSSSGTVSINAGSSSLTLAGSNYESDSFTPGIEDSSGNNAAVTVVTAEYSRKGNIVFFIVNLNITSVAGLVAGDEARITDFPIASAGYAQMSSVCDGPFFFNSPSGNYRITFTSGATFGKFHINDSATSTNRNLLVSEIGTGILNFNGFYFV